MLHWAYRFLVDFKETKLRFLNFLTVCYWLPANNQTMHSHIYIESPENLMVDKIKFLYTDSFKNKLML